MSCYADVVGYNTDCPSCGRDRFEHEDDCCADEPCRAGCGQPAKPKAMLLMGYCSRNCLLDALGETDSDWGSR